MDVVSGFGRTVMDVPSPRFCKSRPAAEHFAPVFARVLGMPICAERGIGRSLADAASCGTQSAASFIGRLPMFFRKQLYVGAALFGAFELAVVLIRSVVR